MYRVKVMRKERWEGNQILEIGELWIEICCPERSFGLFIYQSRPFHIQRGSILLT